MYIPQYDKDEAPFLAVFFRPPTARLEHFVVRYTGQMDCGAELDPPVFHTNYIPCIVRKSAPS